MPWHTPGPGYFDPSAEDWYGHEILGDGRVIAVTCTLDMTDVTVQEVANAHLITAAPDLLEACEDMVRFIQSLPALKPWERMQKENRAAMLSIVQSALKKARG